MDSRANEQVCCDVTNDCGPPLGSGLFGGFFGGESGCCEEEVRGSSFSGGGAARATAAGADVFVTGTTCCVVDKGGDSQSVCRNLDGDT